MTRSVENFKEEREALQAQIQSLEEANKKAAINHKDELEQLGEPEAAPAPPDNPEEVVPPDEEPEQLLDTEETAQPEAARTD